MQLLVTTASVEIRSGHLAGTGRRAGYASCAFARGHLSAVDAVASRLVDADSIDDCAWKTMRPSQLTRLMTHVERLIPHLAQQNTTSDWPRLTESAARGTHFLLGGAMLVAPYLQMRMIANNILIVFFS